MPSGTCWESKLQIKCLIEKFTPCSKATNIRESRGCFKEMGQISEMISNRDHLFETAQEQHPKAEQPTETMQPRLFLLRRTRARRFHSPIAGLGTQRRSDSPRSPSGCRYVTALVGGGRWTRGEQRKGLRQGLLSHGILSPPSHFLTSYKHSHIPHV